MIPQGNKKFRKFRKVKAGGVAGRANDVCFGTYGLKSLESFLITTNQIEAVRKMISKVTKRSGRMWIRCRPNLPVTERPSDVRMGGGKGPVAFWIYKVKAGNILFEVDGISFEEASDLFSRVLLKLPTSGKTVKRKFANLED